MTLAPVVVRQRRRRALAHQCASCRRLWALRLVQDQQGPAVRCCYCGTVRAAAVPAHSDAHGPAEQAVERQGATSAAR